MFAKLTHRMVDSTLGDRGAVDCVTVRGTAVNALLNQSADAQLLVIGEPRPGRMASMLASMVAPQIVQRARCPVVVLPAPGR